MRIELVSTGAAAEPRMHGAAPRSCEFPCGVVDRRLAYLIGQLRAVGPASAPFNIVRHVPSSSGSDLSREPARALLRHEGRRASEEPEKVRAEIQSYLASFASRRSPTMRTAARAPRARQPRCRRSSPRQRRSTSRGGGSSSDDGSSSGSDSSEDGAGGSGAPDHVGPQCRAAAAPLLGCSLAHRRSLSSRAFLTPSVGRGVSLFRNAERKPIGIKNARKREPCARTAI
jgi:hypothetical protein